MVTAGVGIGNVLLSDDGAGVWLARRLAATYRFVPEVQILDGGTLGLDLLPYLSTAERLLVIDAARTGTAPGTIAILREHEVPAVLRQSLSAHEASLCDLLAALTLLGKAPRELVAIGIEPLHVRPGVELSEPVRAALPAAEYAVVGQLEKWGVASVRDETHAETAFTL